MKLLALETSSNTCSIALMNNHSIIEKHQVLPQQHGHVALNWISELLLEESLSIDQLDAICYSAGPGGFTGIRISAAIAQGMALKSNIPVIGVSSLQVIAQGIHREYGGKQIMVIQDARMQQVYCGYYSLDCHGIMRPAQPDQLYDYAEIKLPPLKERWWLVTNVVEIAEIGELSKAPPFQNIMTDYYPKATDVLLLTSKDFADGKYAKNECTQPIYLRGKEGWKKVSP